MYLVRKANSCFSICAKSGAFFIVPEAHPAGRITKNQKHETFR